MCEIAVLGLAVMGRNLALNLEEKGFSVAVYNRTAAATEEFLAATRANGCWEPPRWKSSAPCCNGPARSS